MRVCQSREVRNIGVGRHGVGEWRDGEGNEISYGWDDVGG